MELTPGTRVKNYTLERQLGKGASGEVWRAYDETKTVAIKFMNENLMKSASAAKHRERLLREIEALRKLEHPNVPTLYDYDLDFVRPYLAMRYVGGDSYDRLISTGEMLRIPLERRIEAIRELAFALTAAHDAGIIHRDIKPANMTGIENPFLLDFSISLGKADAERTARFVGTTLYMAPDGVVDRLSDNYSFAVVVFEILFGRHPIYRLGDSVFNQFIADMRIQNREWAFPSAIPLAQLPADLHKADLRRLDAIFERAIGSREQRYADLREFVRDLQLAIFTPENQPAQHFSSFAGVAPHVSQPPPPPQPEPEPEPEPAEEISPEESFLDKAFLNLPAIKPPSESISITSVEQPTPSQPYPAQTAASELEGEAVQIDTGTGGIETSDDESYVEEEDRSSEFASPDAMTMMEMRIPTQPVQDEEEDFAGPEDGTRMEMPIVSPPVEEEDHSSEFAPPDAMTMMEMRVPTQPVQEAEPEEEEDDSIEFAPPDAMTMMEMQAAPRPPEPETEPEPEPAQAEMDDRTMPEIRVPKPPEMDDRTMPEIRIPHPQPPAYQPQPENFTLMEMQAPPRPQQNDSFTLMEMQAAQQPNTLPDPFADENFTQMQMESPVRQAGFDLSTSLGGDRKRRLLIIGLIVVAVVIVLIVAAVALTSGVRVS